MSQEFTYDPNKEMNEMIVPDLLGLVAKFSVTQDLKLKFQIMKEISDNAASFMDYYDYLEEDVA